MAAKMMKHYHIALFPEQDLSAEEIQMDAKTLMLYLDRFCKDNFEGHAYDVVVEVDPQMKCEHCGQDWVADEVGKPLCCTQAALEYARLQVHK